MTRRPWFKFFPSDWRADPGLRSCSLAARGLWIDLIAIMHEASPYGHLLINGKPPSYYRIAQLVGGTDQKAVKRLTAQLQTSGVFSVTSDGILYSRRMVRDRAKSQTARELSKFRWPAEPYALDARKKERGQTEEGKRRKKGAKTQARHRWENDLLRQYGPDEFARTMDVLAADPALVERATRAEQRKPGSGVLAAVIGLERAKVEA